MRRLAFGLAAAASAAAVLGAGEARAGGWCDCARGYGYYGYAPVYAYTTRPYAPPVYGYVATAPVVVVAPQPGYAAAPVYGYYGARAYGYAYGNGYGYGYYEPRRRGFLGIGW